MNDTVTIRRTALEAAVRHARVQAHEMDVSSASKDDRYLRGLSDGQVIAYKAMADYIEQLIADADDIAMVRRIDTEAKAS